MIRPAAFVWHAAERLSSPRLSADDEPELWRKNYPTRLNSD